MDLGLKDKVAVITGGSSGIGLEAVRLFLEEGASVALCGRDEARLASVTEELQSRYSAARVFGATCDVTDAAQVNGFRDRVAGQFERVDILVNNAGQGRVGTFADTTDEAWQAELNLKFFSIIYPTRAFLPLLERSSTGAIVCVNALLARQPEPHMVTTSAARAGVLNLARSLATEFAPKGIRVNSLLLGLVDSGQWQRRYAAAVTADPELTREAWYGALAKQKGIPLGRLGRPDEPARAILFLASPFSSYTTGSAVDVSGGLARDV